MEQTCFNQLETAWAALLKNTVEYRYLFPPRGTSFYPRLAVWGGTTQKMASKKFSLLCEIIQWFTVF